MSATVDPATSGAEVIGTDVFLLNGLVELFYGALSLLPTFLGAPPSLQSVGGPGGQMSGQTPAGKFNWTKKARRWALRADSAKSWTRFLATR